MREVKIVNVEAVVGGRPGKYRQRKYLKWTVIAGLSCFLLSARRVKNSYEFFRINVVYASANKNILPLQSFVTFFTDSERFRYFFITKCEIS